MCLSFYLRFLISSIGPLNEEGFGTIYGQYSRCPPMGWKATIDCIQQPGKKKMRDSHEQDSATLAAWATTSRLPLCPAILGQGGFVIGDYTVAVLG